MEQINSINSTAIPLYPNQPSLAPPNVTVPRAVPASGIGRGQTSVVSTTGEVGVVLMADHGFGTTAGRVRATEQATEQATKQAALPRGVPR